MTVCPAFILLWIWCGKKEHMMFLIFSPSSYIFQWKKIVCHCIACLLIFYPDADTRLLSLSHGFDLNVSIYLRLIPITSLTLSLHPVTMELEEFDRVLRDKKKKLTTGGREGGGHPNHNVSDAYLDRLALGSVCIWVCLPFLRDTSKCIRCCLAIR